MFCVVKSILEKLFVYEEIVICWLGKVWFRFVVIFLSIGLIYIVCGCGLFIIKFII